MDNNVHTLEDPTESVSDQAKPSINVRSSGELGCGSTTPTHESICAVDVEASTSLDQICAQDIESAIVKKTLTKLNFRSTQETKDYNNVMVYFQETDSAVAVFAEDIRHAVQYKVYLKPISEQELRRNLPKHMHSVIHLSLFYKEVLLLGHRLCQEMKEIERSMRSCSDQKNEIKLNWSAVVSSTVPLNITDSTHESINILFHNLVSVNNSIQRMKGSLRLYLKGKEEALSIKLEVSSLLDEN